MHRPTSGAEHRRGDAERGELGGAEVADDGGVGEQEQRLGDQGEEGRHGQAQDLPVVRARGRSRSDSTAYVPQAHRHGWSRQDTGHTLCKTRPICGYHRSRQGLCRQTRQPSVQMAAGEQQARNFLRPQAHGRRIRRSEPVCARTVRARPQRRTNRLCTPPAACSTRSTGLSTGACGRRAWSVPVGPVASATAVRSEGVVGVAAGNRRRGSEAVLEKSCTDGHRSR